MIGLLNAYYFQKDEDYQKQYTSIFFDFVKANFKNEEVRVFNVALGEWPQSPNEAKAWIISGSTKGSYEDFEWIKQLSHFIRDCDSKKIKLIGICFGHQLIAHSLGGRTQKHEAGWGVGVKEFSILKHSPWMTPHLKSARLLFSHQDQVVSLPPNALHIGQSDFCKYQMFSIGSHIFTMQGHPEYTPDFARLRLNSRKDVISKPVFDTALKSLDSRTDADTFGKWMVQFVKF